MLTLEFSISHGLLQVIVHPSVSNDEAEKIFGKGNVEYASEFSEQGL